MPTEDQRLRAAHHALAERLRQAARLLDTSADVAEANPFCEDVDTFMNHIEPLFEAERIVREVLQAAKPTLELLAKAVLRQEMARHLSRQKDA
jgi:hypothetical protein